MENISIPREQASTPAEPREHSKGLLVIGIFKLLKSLSSLLVGFGALHFLKVDLGDTITQIATAFKFDPESHFLSLLLSKVDMIDSHKLMHLSEVSFLYAGLALVEGIGLLMEKTWAEYFTLILSISFLPWEMFELVHHPTIWIFGIMVINIGVVLYLLWLLRYTRANRRK